MFHADWEWPGVDISTMLERRSTPRSLLRVGKGSANHINETDLNLAEIEYLLQKVRRPSMTVLSKMFHTLSRTTGEKL